VPALTCPSCDDYNACTVDSCDTTTGTCRHDPLSCDDGNACTKDSCDAFPEPSGGCRHTYLSAGTACNDGNARTANDACNGSGLCAGVMQAAGSTCDDGNSCTTSDTCDANGVCGGTALAPGPGRGHRHGCT